MDNKLIEFLVNQIPWFSAVLGCLVNGGGYYDPQFPQLKDAYGNIRSNSLNVEFQNEDLIFREFAITQNNEKILEISFEVNQSCEGLKFRFFKRMPDLMTQHSYSFVDDEETVKSSSLIWVYPDYKISVRENYNYCKISISTNNNRPSTR